MTSPTGETNKRSLDKCSLPPYKEPWQPDLYDDVMLALPPPTATPTEVADFLVRRLVANDMPIERARCIASNGQWGLAKNRAST